MPIWKTQAEMNLLIQVQAATQNILMNLLSILKSYKAEKICKCKTSLRCM